MPPFLTSSKLSKQTLPIFKTNSTAEKGMRWTLPVKWLSFDPSRQAESIFSAAKNILHSDAFPRMLHMWASLRDYNWSAIAGNKKVWTWMIWIALGNGWRCTMGWNGLARRSSLSLSRIHRVSLIYSIASGGGTGSAWDFGGWFLYLAHIIFHTEKKWQTANQKLP